MTKGIAASHGNRFPQWDGCLAQDWISAQYMMKTETWIIL